jgi:hypothetical protein
MSDGYSNNISLEQQLKNLKYRWEVATKKYVTHYSDSKLGLDVSQFNRALAQVRTTYNDINILKANLDGNISSNDKNLKDKNKMINDIKNQYSDQHTELKSKLGEHKSAIPFKIQKYDENSKSYIFSSFYTISIFTMFFFIYKQIKME